MPILVALCQSKVFSFNFGKKKKKREGEKDEKQTLIQWVEGTLVSYGGLSYQKKLKTICKEQNVCQGSAVPIFKHCYHLLYIITKPGIFTIS